MKRWELFQYLINLAPKSTTLGPSIVAFVATILQVNPFPGIVLIFNLKRSYNLEEPQRYGVCLKPAGSFWDPLIRALCQESVPRRRHPTTRGGTDWMEEGWELVLNGRKRGQSRKELLPRRARFGPSASSAGCPDSANTSITHQLPLIGMIGMARADPSAEEAGSLCDLSTPRGKPHRRSHRGTEHLCRAKNICINWIILLFKGLLKCAESKHLCWAKIFASVGHSCFLNSYWCVQSWQHHMY